MSYLLDYEMRSSSLSTFMKSQGYKGKYSNKKHTNTNKALMYCVKDGDIVDSSGFTSEEIEELVERQSELQDKIDSEKGMPMKDKLLNYVVELADPFADIDLGKVDGDKFRALNTSIHVFKHQILKYICKFYHDAKLLPPNRVQMFQYVTYIVGQVCGSEYQDDMYEQIIFGTAI